MERSQRSEKRHGASVNTKETLGYSEEWMMGFVYNVVLLAKEDAKNQRKKTNKSLRL